MVTVHRSRLTKTTLEELSEQERRTILLRPGEARRIRGTNQETYDPSRYGESGSEISSDSSSSDEPGEGADNGDSSSELNADMDEPRDWGNTWTQYQPWVVTDEFWEEMLRMEGWQEAVPAELTMPTTRDQRETMHMDTSPTKRKTGTVPARLTSYNGRMRWTSSKPDCRHHYQSNGKEKRSWMNNRNRNFNDEEEQSQSTQRRGTVLTNPGALPFPAGQRPDDLHQRVMRSLHVVRVGRRNQGKAMFHSGRACDLG